MNRSEYYTSLSKVNRSNWESFHVSRHAVQAAALLWPHGWSEDCFVLSGDSLILDSLPYLCSRLPHTLRASSPALSDHSAPNYSPYAFSLLQAIYLALCLNFQLPYYPSLFLWLISHLFFLCYLNSLVSVSMLFQLIPKTEAVTICTFHSSHSVTLSMLWLNCVLRKDMVKPQS